MNVISERKQQQHIWKSIAAICALAALCCTFAMPALAQNPWLPMPDLVVAFIDTPAETHAGADLGGRVHVMIVNHGTGAVGGGYTLDFVISSDRKVPASVPQFSASYKEDALLANGRVENLPALGSEDTYSFTQGRLLLPDDMPLGSYWLCAFVDSHNVIKEEQREERDGITTNTLCAPMHIVAPTSGRPTPQPPITSSPSRFDTDRSCKHEDGEFFTAVDLWMTQKISDELFFAVFDSWISQENLCTSAASAELRLVKQSGRWLLISPGTTHEMTATIYDTNGSFVISLQSHGNNLSWNLQDHFGHAISNGLYFAKIFYQTASGVKSAIKKILVVR